MSESTESTAPAARADDTFGAAEFAAASKVRYVRVPIGDRFAYLRSLPESERAKWDSSALDENGEVDRERMLTRRARLLAMILVDKTGKRLFGDDDWPKLSNVDGAITSKLFTSAVKHLGLNDQSAEDEAKN
jgi:hypothetical protein